MPFFLFCGVDWCRKPTFVQSILLGIGVGLVALSSPYYVVFFLVPVFAIMGIYLLFRHSHKIRTDRRFLKSGIIVLAASLIVVLPFYWGFIEYHKELTSINTAFAMDPYFYAADILSWILPSGEHPFWGRWTGPVYRRFTTPNLMETTLFLGFLPILLFLASLVVPSSWKRSVTTDLAPWQMLAALTLVLSFGPVLHFNGTEILSWMPYRLLMMLPGSETFRIPSRVGITSALAVIVVDMVLVDGFSQKMPLWATRAGVLFWGMALLFNLPFDFPFPTSDAGIPTTYQQVEEMPGEFAILELPAGESFFSSMSRYMYYQTYHEKRLVSGYLGRRPLRLHEQEHLLPFVKYFFNPDFFLGSSDIQMIPAAEIASAEVDLHNLGIRYIVLHCPSSGPTTYCDFALPLLESSVGVPSSVERLAGETIYLYSIKISASASCFSSSPLSVFVGETLQISLLGWSLRQNSSGDLSWDTTWSCTGVADRDYTLYVHYLDSSFNMVDQGDHLLGSSSSNAYFPTSQWLCPGYYFDSVSIPLDSLTDGLSIAFGIWDPNSGVYLRPAGQLFIDGAARVRISLLDVVLTSQNE